MNVPEVGDLVKQSRNHRSRVESDWGIGTVAAQERIYVKVYWSRWDRFFKMHLTEIELINV